MITPEAAGLAVTAAKGLIKLTQRVDLVLAERVAVQGLLPTIQPSMILRPPPEVTVPALERLLTDTPTEPQDALGPDRVEIQTAVDDARGGAQNNDILVGFMHKHLPEQALGDTLDLNGDVLRALKKRRPDWDLHDAEVRIAAFAISPGEDSRQKGYTWRLALTVVDVLAEFGAENTALFTRDERTQGIVKAILQRFAAADLQTTDSGDALVRAALSATLNGALDAKEHLDVGEEWLDGLLGALLAARASVPEARRDEFLLGLFRGKGYPRLVGALLTEAATRLATDDATVFESIAADVLKEAGAQFARGTKFGEFLKTHWGDLLRAGLGSLAKRGNVVFADQSPIVQGVLSATISELSETPNHKFLSGEMLVGVVDAAVGAVATKPDLLEGIDPPWLQTFVRSVATTISSHGVRKTFSQAGLEATVTGVLAAFSEHPELIVANPGLAQELVRGVLADLSKLDRQSAEVLAKSVLGSALDVLAARPELAGTRYPKLIGSLAGHVGDLVEQKSLSKVQAGDVVRVLAQSVAENPELFVKTAEGLATIVVDAVVDVSKGNHGKLIAGATLVEVLRSVAEAAAASGQAALDRHPLSALKAGIMSVLVAGLQRAETQLGRELGVSAIAPILGGLVTAWARGDLAQIDPTDAQFQALFSQLAARAAA